MGRFAKRLRKSHNTGNDCVTSNRLPKYRTYHFTEDWTTDLSKAPEEANMLIIDKYYDMFQYFLNYLRSEQIRFVLFPIEQYSRVTGEPMEHSKGMIMDGTNFIMDEDSNTWAICVKRYINNKYDLMVLGHEIGHVINNHRVEQVAGADYMKVNYRYEYEADIFAINVLHHFGYYTDEQRKKLIELSQINFIVETKVLPAGFYETYKKVIRTYDRSKGLLSDVISRMILDGIAASDIPKMLQGGKD